MTQTDLSGIGAAIRRLVPNANIGMGVQALVGLIIFGGVQASQLDKYHREVRAETIARYRLELECAKVDEPVCKKLHVTGQAAA